MNEPSPIPDRRPDFVIDSVASYLARRRLIDADEVCKALHTEVAKSLRGENARLRHSIAAGWEADPGTGTITMTLVATGTCRIFIRPLGRELSQGAAGWIQPGREESIEDQALTPFVLEAVRSWVRRTRHRLAPRKKKRREPDDGSSGEAG